MTQDRHVHMANQIAEAFRSMPEPEAVAATVDHIAKFWDPRMRDKLRQHLQADATAFNPIALAAARQLWPDPRPERSASTAS